MKYCNKNFDRKIFISKTFQFRDWQNLANAYLKIEIIDMKRIKKMPSLFYVFDERFYYRKTLITTKKSKSSIVETLIKKNEKIQQNKNKTIAFDFAFVSLLISFKIIKQFCTKRVCFEIKNYF